MRRVHGINDTPVAVRDNIDSEYDNVKTVADNIEDVKSVAEAIEGLEVGRVDEVVAGDNVEVDSTNPARPVVSVPELGSIDSIQAGTNVNVDINDTRNPVISSTDEFQGTLKSVVAGTNVTVDNTDPDNPVISAEAGEKAPVNLIDAFDTENIHERVVLTNDNKTFHGKSYTSALGVVSKKDSGKWQIRYTVSGTSFGSWGGVGIATEDIDKSTVPMSNNSVGDNITLSLINAGSFSVIGKFNNSEMSDIDSQLAHDELVTGDYIDILVDLDDNLFSVLINGSPYQTDINIPEGVTWFPVAGNRSIAYQVTMDVMGEFFTPEDGYSVWNTLNPVYIEEAPNDGKDYIRNSGEWVELELPTSFDSYVASDGKAITSIEDFPPVGYSYGGKIAVGSSSGRWATTDYYNSEIYVYDWDGSDFVGTQLAMAAPISNIGDGGGMGMSEDGNTIVAITPTNDTTGGSTIFTYVQASDGTWSIGTTDMPVGAYGGYSGKDGRSITITADGLTLAFTKYRTIMRMARISTSSTVWTLDHESDGVLDETSLQYAGISGDADYVYKTGSDNFETEEWKWDGSNYVLNANLPTATLDYMREFNLTKDGLVLYCLGGDVLRVFVRSSTTSSWELTSEITVTALCGYDPVSPYASSTEDGSVITVGSNGGAGGGNFNVYMFGRHGDEWALDYQDIEPVSNIYSNNVSYIGNGTFVASAREAGFMAYQVPLEQPIEEAPKDGESYVRKDGAWDVQTNVPFIMEDAEDASRNLAGEGDIVPLYAPTNASNSGIDFDPITLVEGDEVTFKVSGMSYESTYYLMDGTGNGSMYISSYGEGIQTRLVDDSGYSIVFSKNDASVNIFDGGEHTLKLKLLVGSREFWVDDTLVSTNFTAGFSSIVTVSTIGATTTGSFSYSSGAIYDINIVNKAKWSLLHSSASTFNLEDTVGGNTLIPKSGPDPVTSLHTVYIEDGEYVSGELSVLKEGDVWMYNEAESKFKPQPSIPTIVVTDYPSTPTPNTLYIKVFE